MPHFLTNLLRHNQLNTAAWLDPDGVPLLAILFAHAVAALLAPSLVRVMGRNAFLPLALVPLGSLG